jgi:hypothetical protein
MKKWIALALIVCVAGVAQAAKKPQTKEEYVAAKKELLEKQGKTFDQAKVEAKFDKQDKDKDGVWSIEEQTPAKKSEHPNKKKSEHPNKKKEGAAEKKEHPAAE